MESLPLLRERISLCVYFSRSQRTFTRGSCIFVDTQSLVEEIYFLFSRISRVSGALTFPFISRHSKPLAERCQRNFYGFAPCVNFQFSGLQASSCQRSCFWDGGNLKSGHRPAEPFRGLQNLCPHQMAGPHLGHDGYRYLLFDLGNRGRIRHPGDTALFADIRRQASLDSETPPAVESGNFHSLQGLCGARSHWSG